MPRSNGIYSPPPGTGGTPQTVISSAMFNAWVADISADQNNPRPIIAGGTGSATSQGAIDAFFGAPRTIIDERLLFVDPSDPTKRVRLDAGDVTAGQTRVLRMPDHDLEPLNALGDAMTGLLTLAPSDDDPGGTASLNIPAGADTPDVQADGDLWADGNENLRYRRGGADATVYDSVNLPRPAPGEMAAGTETAPRALSAADVREGVALSKMWESAPQAITAGGGLTLAHNLGVKPILLVGSLVNVTAEHGYSPGDEVPYWLPGFNAVARGVTIFANSSDVKIKYGSYGTGSPMYYLRADTGGSDGVTLANWKFVVRAFA